MMELGDEHNTSQESNQSINDYPKEQVKDLKLDGVRDFYVSDFRAKYLTKDKSKKYMIGDDGVKLQRVMSMNWLVKEAHRTIEKGTFDEEFPFYEDSKEFNKLVKSWEKYHNDIVPWKKPKSAPTKRNISKLGKQPKDQETRISEKDLKKLSKSLNKVTL